RDTKPEIRRKTIAALNEAVSSELKEDDDWDRARLAAPVFQECLKDADSEVRSIASRALYQFGIGPEAEAEVAWLIQPMLDKDPVQRFLAARHLSSWKPASPAAVSALTKALEDPELSVRRQAGCALAALVGSKAKTAVPLLIDALKDKSAIARVRCVDMDAA